MKKAVKKAARKPASTKPKSKEPSLESLIAEVDAIFGTGTGSKTFVYTIGRIQSYWRLDVVNDWHQWIDKKLKYEFVGPSPAAVLRSFLSYVKSQKIDVRSLMESSASN